MEPVKFEDIIALANNVGDARFAMLCGYENPEYVAKIRAKLYEAIEQYIKQGGK